MQISNKKANRYAAMLLLNCSELAAEISGTVKIPVIDIGAPAADSQVLVLHDMLGLSLSRPYAEVREENKWPAKNATSKRHPLCQSGQGQSFPAILQISA